MERGSLIGAPMTAMFSKMSAADYKITWWLYANQIWKPYVHSYKQASLSKWPSKTTKKNYVSSQQETHSPAQGVKFQSKAYNLIINSQITFSVNFFENIILAPFVLDCYQSKWISKLVRLCSLISGHSIGLNFVCTNLHITKISSSIFIIIIFICIAHGCLSTLF